MNAEIDKVFPRPWTVDVSPQETPPTRRSAKVYDADSCLICQTHGADAEELATFIAESVNARADLPAEDDVPCCPLRRWPRCAVWSKRGTLG